MLQDRSIVFLSSSLPGASTSIAMDEQPAKPAKTSATTAQRRIIAKQHSSEVMTLRDWIEAADINRLYWVSTLSTKATSTTKCNRHAAMLPCCHTPLRIYMLCCGRSSYRHFSRTSEAGFELMDAGTSASTLDLAALTLPKTLLQIIDLETPFGP